MLPSFSPMEEMALAALDRDQIMARLVGMWLVAEEQMCQQISLSQYHRGFVPPRSIIITLSLLSSEYREDMTGIGPADVGRLGIDYDEFVRAIEARLEATLKSQYRYHLWTIAWRMHGLYKWIQNRLARLFGKPRQQQ